MFFIVFEWMRASMLYQFINIFNYNYKVKKRQRNNLFS